jgi:DNA repair exonuclease SbcCD ATPase subunit
MFDLFSKPMLLSMKKELKDLNFEDPHVQVIWEDFPDNFSGEKIKRIKSYFEKKYRSRNVNVITRIKSNNIDTIKDVNNLDVLNKDFQKELIVSYINDLGYEKDKEKILEIDDYVNKSMSQSELDYIPFNKWYIEKIKFSNFLSFGENQILDFEGKDGISVIESDPPNFGGKTILSVDLLMFLFFNTTTKTTKAEQIFNKYTDKDEVSVEGHIKIDGENFIILRKLKRKKNRQGDWKVSTTLEFYKKFSDGSLENYTGEQRRETENFIKKSIGELSDFLMTILTTSSNLENLIDSKPTARAETVARFLGLDNLKLKEEYTKKMINEYSKSMISNVFNRFDLQEEIKKIDSEIEEKTIDIRNKNSQVVDLESREDKGNKYRDELLSKKNVIEDFKFFILETEQEKLKDLQNRLDEIISDKNKVNVKEPSDFFDEEKLESTIEKIVEINLQLQNDNDLLVDTRESFESKSEDSCCDFCGTLLSDTDFFEKKNNDIFSLEKRIENNEKKLTVLNENKNRLNLLKTEFLDYERNKLIFENFISQEESLSIRVTNQMDKINHYFKNQEKIKENIKIESLLVKSDLRLNDIQDQIKILNSEVSVLESEIIHLREKIVKNNETISRIDQENEKLRIFKIYGEVFGKNGISKRVMKTMLPVINQELERVLIDCTTFNLNVTMSEKNEINFVMIDHNSGVEKPLESGSGYEKTISSIALRSVLSKICSLPKPNVIVFDEVFGKISNDNLESTFEIFKKIKSYFDNIFIITHNPLISQWSDNIISITKKDNISKLV